MKTIVKTLKKGYKATTKALKKVPHWIWWILIGLVGGLAVRRRTNSVKENAKAAKLQFEAERHVKAAEDLKPKIELIEHQRLDVTKELQDVEDRAAKLRAEEIAAEFNKMRVRS